MWLDDLQPGDSWMGVWKYKIFCGHCSAIMEGYTCPICNYAYDTRPVIHEINGDKHTVYPSFMGAVGYNTYAVLELIRREWERPLIEESPSSFNGDKIPQRLVIVLLFWMLFENLMETFFNKFLETLPVNVRKDLMKRYGSIGTRIDQLYRILFSTSFKDDLTDLGFGHLYDHIRLVQTKRNEFVHNNPAAIDDALITQTITYLQDVQFAWMMLYNKRCANIAKAI